MHQAAFSTHYLFRSLVGVVYPQDSEEHKQKTEQTENTGSQLKE